MTRLLLVRHGESDWNATRRLQGQADIPLSARGRAQATSLRATIEALGPDRAATSDLMRARDTATLLGFPHAEPRADLRENDVGRWTGLPIAALKAEDLEAYRGWRAGTVTPPGGEVWADFRVRTCAAVLGLADGGVSTLLIVAHGGVVRALLDGFLDLRPDQIIPVGPASLTILRTDGARFRGMRLEVFNFNPDGPILNAPD